MHNKRINWTLVKKPISELKPHPKNPRIITEKGLKQLEESFDDIGFAQPVNINLDGTILSGHARIQQLQKEGQEFVDCYVPDRSLTPKQEEAVIVRMNKNVAGEWDFDILKSEFDLENLLDWGFSEIDFPKMLEPVDYSDKNSEIDTDNFGNDLNAMCPKCSFEFSV
jgi:hypothetical protein